jgi:superfamily II DNA helicase RecQ
MTALRAWRTETARRDKVPPYVVLSDAHLEGIAAVAPTSLRELARCKGIGPAKLEKYGDDLLAVIEAAAPDEQSPQPLSSGPGSATHDSS